jgi:RecB family endonuclease NucS
MVVKLPEKCRLSSGELRPTIAKVKSRSLRELTFTMADEANWIPLWAHFDYERALSGYIAAYPHRLEDGLLPYPNERLRERMFKDETRLDVLLMDKEQVPVVVECKQGSPTRDDVHQLRGYMRHVRKEVGRRPRGILVHGGARNLRDDVRRLAASRPKIQVVQHRLEVGFSTSA